MDRGLYIAGTAMLTNRQRMDVISNNIANANTTGFKADTFVSRSFNDMLISATNEHNIVNKTAEVGPLNTGIHVDAVYTDFSNGVITSSDIPTDFAIEGNGFFVVNTPQGERYTRDGSFHINAAGNLVNQDGYEVMGTNGVINVGTGELSVNEMGDISVDDEVVGSFRIVTVDDLDSLRKEGANLYNGNANDTNEGFMIRQRALETSNTDVTTSIVDMMKVFRNYESNQVVIQTIDNTLSKAVNLGSIN